MKVAPVVFAIALTLAVAGCGGTGGNASSLSPQTSGQVPKENAHVAEVLTRRCVDLWNGGRFDQDGEPKLFARTMTDAGSSRYPALVTRDSPGGICLVAFPESGGSEGAYTFSYEKNGWDLYLLYKHESAPLDPNDPETSTFEEEINRRAKLIKKLGIAVEREPNAYLERDGSLTLLAENSEGTASTTPKDCGMTTETPGGKINPAKEEVIGMSCAEGMKVLGEWNQAGQTGAHETPAGFVCASQEDFCKREGKSVQLQYGSGG